MADIMKGLGRILTIINIKTCNFMEKIKLKTGISTKESEILELKMQLGNLVYENREEFSFDIVKEIVDTLDEKYKSIDAMEKQIDDLYVNEKEILGEKPKKPVEEEVAAPASADATDAAEDAPVEDDKKPEESAVKMYCGQCGAANPTTNKFCEKCGNKFE